MTASHLSICFQTSFPFFIFVLFGFGGTIFIWVLLLLCCSFFLLFLCLQVALRILPKGNAFVHIATALLEHLETTWHTYLQHILLPIFSTKIMMSVQQVARLKNWAHLHDKSQLFNSLLALLGPGRRRGVIPPQQITPHLEATLPFILPVLHYFVNSIIPAESTILFNWQTYYQTMLRASRH